jgi:two-component system, chemotaxis family, sensor kinase CheA
MAQQDSPSTNEADLERIVALIEEAAGAVVMASASDRDAIAAIGRIFDKIVAATLGLAMEPLAKEGCRTVTRVVASDGDEASALLDRLGEIVTELQRAATQALMTGDASPAPAPPPAPEAAPKPAASATPASAPPANAPPAAATRDEEIVELLGDFLQEAEEGVDKVDDLLLQIEQSGVEAERINALFRVFHTIKGVAASLEVMDVTRLAHATETLLDQARSGILELAGERIERVFESAALMRKLLGSTRKAVQAGTEFEVSGEVPPMIQKLDAVLAGKEDHAPKSVAARSQRTPAAPPKAEPPKAALPKAEPPKAEPPKAEAALLFEAPEPPKAAPAPKLVAEPRSEPPQEERAPAEPKEPSPAAAPAQSITKAAGKLRETVKVDLDRVDSIVEMIGELIIVESMVVNAPEIATLSSLRVRNYLSQLTKISRDLQNVAMRMRMVPVSGVFQKMARMVRDLSRKTGKNVVLVQSGESAEMDRSMVERIEDPLVHMIRNSVDHGIEPDRTAAGKPAQGTVKLSAYHEGGSIVIEITDDGRGLSRDAILKKARAQGLIRETDNPSDAEVWGLIFLPGFSTASQVTEISGRGVGMDVVKRSIESMRGRVTVTSTPGQGTTFRMLLPLTLAIIDGMLVASGEERYIIPSLSIVESLKPAPGMVHTFADRGELINVRGEMLPLVRLTRIFGVFSEERAPTDALVVVVESMGRRVGLLVDDVITQQQVVIKPLGEGLGDTELLAGAAILSDGRVGLILNVDRIGGDAGAGQILHRTRAVAEEAA